MKILILDATTKSITAIMAGAAATTNPDFTAHYADATTSSFLEGSNDGVLNGTTPVTLVASPGASTQRIIKAITIQNRDTAAVVVTIRYVSSGGTRQIWKGTLAVGDTWTLDGVFDQLGNLKSSVYSFNDAEGDPVEIGTAADGISLYASRRDHIHAAQKANINNLKDTDGPIFDHLHITKIIESKGINISAMAENYYPGVFGALMGLTEDLGRYPWTDLGQQAAETYILSLAYLGNGIALAGTGGHGKIFRSTDYGATWTDLGQQAAETHIYSLAYLGNGIALAGTYPNGKIFRSTDYGATWTNLGQQAAETYILSLAYLGNGIALAGTALHGKIFRSTDYGATWTDLGQQAAETHIFSIAYLGNGIALAGTYPNGKIFRSVNLRIL
jgi:hypothetical protein